MEPEHTLTAPAGSGAGIKLLLASPAIQTLRLLGRQFPVLRAPSVVDDSPRMRPTHAQWSQWRGRYFPGH